LGSWGLIERTEMWQDTTNQRSPDSGHDCGGATRRRELLPSGAVQTGTGEESDVRRVKATCQSGVDGVWDAGAVSLRPQRDRTGNWIEYGENEREKQL